MQRQVLQVPQREVSAESRGRAGVWEGGVARVSLAVGDESARGTANCELRTVPDTCHALLCLTRTKKEMPTTDDDADGGREPRQRGK